MPNIKNKMKSIAYRLYEAGRGVKRADDPEKKWIHSRKTLQTYIAEIDRYAGWLKSQGVKGRCTEQEAARYVQPYLNHLVSMGKSPATVHTATAALCKVFGLKMADFDKPQRVTPPRKGRGPAPSLKRRSDADLDDPKYVRLVKFAQVVGVRRSEYGQLKGRNLVQVGGYSYVVVEQGKGGRMQYQRIDPADLPLVKSYFEGLGPDDLVFSENELKNKINLHGLRREHAKKMYQQYADRLQADPQYRERLISELKEAFEIAREDWKKNQDMKRILKGNRWYYCRSNVRRDMRSNGRAVKYDRLALLATSVFHLAHWRCDVTVTNYLR